MAGQPGFFDWGERYAALSGAGDPLEGLALVIEFELFRHDPRPALSSAQQDRLFEASMRRVDRSNKRIPRKHFLALARNATRSSCDNLDYVKEVGLFVAQQEIFTGTYGHSKIKRRIPAPLFHS